MTIDIGAELAVVKPAMVDVENYTGRGMVSEVYEGKQEKVQIARVWLHLGEYSMKREVVVSEETKDDVLLGLDIGIINYLMELEKEQKEQRENEVSAMTVKRR